MYREPSSPGFDLHEFPTLRRVKPLPKRRRTSSTTGVPTGRSSGSAPSSPFITASLPLDMLGESFSDSMTTEQLLAHAEEISKKIHHSIYMAGGLNSLMSGSGIDFTFGTTSTTTSGKSEGDVGNAPGAPSDGAANQFLSEVELLSEAASKAHGLPAEILRNLTEKLSLPNFPPPFASPNGRVDLDAIFAAGYEAGMNGAGLSSSSAQMLRNGMPQSKYAPYYRPQYHQQAAGTGQGVLVDGQGQDGDEIEGFSGEETAGMGPGVAGGLISASVVGVDVTVDVRRQRGARDEEDDDDEDGDGDYMDHLRQPGNTKKRKVPANAGMSLRGGMDREDDSEVLGGAKRAADGGPDGDECGDDGVHHDPHHEGSMGDSAPNGGGMTRSNPFSHGASAVAKSARLPLPALSSLTVSTSSSARVGQLHAVLKARGKLTAAMVAGLQHKEMLKARKRQLATVMGALTHGDNLALDQALSMAGSAYPFGGPLGALGLPPSSIGNKDSMPAEEKQSQVKTRYSKRLPARLAREAKVRDNAPRKRHPLLAGDIPFKFQCPSPTAERLLATKKEVVTLRSRFEQELERQASKAAKLAAANKVDLPKPGTSTSTRPAKKAAKGNKRSATGGNRGLQQQNQQLPQQQQPAPAPRPQQPQTKAAAGTQHVQKTVEAETGMPQPILSKPKKKKRSALANASNPHHLRNYVPSRLPHSGGTPNAASASQNHFGPLPLRFLNAELPPVRGAKKKSGSVTAGPGTVVGQSEEWICMFCDYDLFYGDDGMFRRAVKSRKKVLKRRRRARERAAAAASGVKSLSNKGAHQANGNSAAAVPNSTQAMNGGDVGTDYDDDDGDEFDGDPGYETGGNGKDEYGNVPKHQCAAKGGTGGHVCKGGGGRVQNGPVSTQAPPTG